MTLTPAQFQKKILTWFHQSGRKHLPWQQVQSPYFTWLSEIMLQQTQVTTVIPYFQRFTHHFPTLSSLANASLDEVIRLWSGLGYYARARHLHRCAQIIEEKYKGEFPQALILLQNLPGIGRSTAGAIRALAFNQPAAILDGNVKRVFSRFHMLSGWPGLTHVNKQLWTLAERYTPHNKHVRHYTQAMMDLGALICTPKHAQCTECPLQRHCKAYKEDCVIHYPSSKPVKMNPSRAITMVILINARQEILLEKRPPRGIWGGLWSLPECTITEKIKNFCKKNYHCETEKSIKNYPFLKHTFSHFQLEIRPVAIRVKKWSPPQMESNPIVWYNKQQLASIGLAAPVKKLLNQLIEA
ncbi:A/G-specific adenine glycosylase [Rickettsiella grylli]|uniref:A/G-specific adenine glycosylase n=1 Tax=Rickettsiella grylli TaxID=59196 RepID=UPI0008FD4536|nr:A/G-specific adenine glycosylase [Rickettsiella grylli]OIZ97959.1 A/G-specific adenine glycosylase [Rickettsiella grylli]